MALSKQKGNIKNQYKYINFTGKSAEPDAKVIARIKRLVSMMNLSKILIFMFPFDSLFDFHSCTRKRLN